MLSRKAIEVMPTVTSIPYIGHVVEYPTPDLEPRDVICAMNMWKSNHSLSFALAHRCAFA